MNVNFEIDLPGGLTVTEQGLSGQTAAPVWLARFNG